MEKKKWLQADHANLTFVISEYTSLFCQDKFDKENQMEVA